MSSPNQIVTAATKDVATYTVKIDGEAIPQAVRIAGIVVFKAIGKIPFARVEVHDGDPAVQTFEASSGDLFVPGNEVEILAGYRSEETPIFKGVVVSQQLRVRTPSAFEVHRFPKLLPPQVQKVRRQENAPRHSRIAGPRR